MANPQANGDGEKVAVRGLEGIIAAESSVSYVDGIHGRLLYQGYDIHDLADPKILQQGTDHWGCTL